jgi:hypothetical protein
MPKNWKLFENIVAAIHHAESSGAKVVWNDKINGRQFDVAVRFQYGSHDYLTVIECKNHKKPLSIEKVEAFVTKSNDVRANKAIMVSSSGYQKGYGKVVEKHNIDLFTLKEINQIPKEVLNAEVIPTLNIYDVRLYTNDSPPSLVKLREEKNMLPYLMRNVIFNHESRSVSLEALVDINIVRIMAKADQNDRAFKILLPSGCKAYVPTLEREVAVSSILFKCKIVSAKILTGQTLDPFLLQKAATTYEYEDIIKGTKRRFALEDLEIGFDNTFGPNKFYVDPKTEFSYYCKKVENEVATMYLAESYQHGQLFQAELEMETKYAGNYIEITDRAEIKRLSKLLSHLHLERKRGRF